MMLGWEIGNYEQANFSMWLLKTVNDQYARIHAACTCMNELQPQNQSTVSTLVLYASNRLINRMQ